MLGKFIFCMIGVTLKKAFGLVVREVHFLYDWCNIKEGVWPGQFQIFFRLNVVNFVKRNGLINNLPQRSASLSCRL